MYAVVRTGGKQHRVTKGERIKIEKLDAEVGAEVKLSEVLMVGGKTPKVGTPCVDGAAVTVRVVAQALAPKVTVFKRLKRKGFHKKKGHRQAYTEVEVVQIEG